jgi:hypothetical protein
LENPKLIEAPAFKTGLFSSKTLNLREIEKELQTNYDAMEDFGKNLTPGQNDSLFVGVGIVVLQS